MVPMEPADETCLRPWEGFTPGEKVIPVRTEIRSVRRRRGNLSRLWKEVETWKCFPVIGRMTWSRTIFRSTWVGPLLVQCRTAQETFASVVRLLQAHGQDKWKEATNTSECGVTIINHWCCLCFRAVEGKAIANSWASTQLIKHTTLHHYFAFFCLVHSSTYQYEVAKSVQ